MAHIIRSWKMGMEEEMKRQRGWYWRCLGLWRDGKQRERKKRNVCNRCWSVWNIFPLNSFLRATLYHPGRWEGAWGSLRHLPISPGRENQLNNHSWLVFENSFMWDLCFVFHWSILDLQRCVSFRCTAQWFSYIYMYTDTHIYVYFRFFSIIGYYKILSIVPCAIQWSLLVIYLIYSSVWDFLSTWSEMWAWESVAWTWLSRMRFRNTVHSPLPPALMPLSPGHIWPHLHPWPGTQTHLSRPLRPWSCLELASPLGLLPTAPRLQPSSACLLDDQHGLWRLPESVSNTLQFSLSLLCSPAVPATLTFSCWCLLHSYPFYSFPQGPVLSKS